MNCHQPVIVAFSLLLCLSAAAQKTDRTVPEKCGTVQHLEQQFQQHPLLRKRFEEKRIEFSRTISTRGQIKARQLNSTVYIPVVFHIVLDIPNLVTDDQVQAVLDTLNKDFSGANADSVKIPSYFKPLFGKSAIQFSLARRTPDGDPTTGIERIITSKTSFGLDDGVKHSYSGGVASWNTSKYLNFWICPLAGGLLGYGTIPEDGTPPSDEGVVIEYRSLPGGSLTAFNGGKTLTHEVGHFFNLYHIWGDDDGSCTGSDDVGDTPNQADATSGCPTGVLLDKCTPAGDGVMYQNYMDYSDDPCLVMFTNGQVDRMESALTFYRSSLMSSNGSLPVILGNYDVQLRSVNQPFQRICGSAFTPQVTIKNRGLQNLTSVQINTQIDNGPVTTYPWKGSLATLNTAVINLSNLNTTPGSHTLTVYVSDPNNNTDQDKTNDTIQINFEYSTPVNQVNESFEGAVFPPAGWDVVNLDNEITWKQVKGIAKTGDASVKIDNYNYDHVGATDDLRMPLVSAPATIDSAFLSFQIAAATYSDVSTKFNDWDTLEILVSKDCGKSFTSVYKKWGSTLTTVPYSTSLEYIPTSSEWRKDSINLSDFAGSDLMITFRNTTGFENNIYLDDINFRTVTVHPNLKAQGFLVTPNPTSGAIAVQFYPQPSNLKAIQLFNEMGQKIGEVIVTNGQANNYYSFDLSKYARGMYIVKAIFTDRVLTKKIIRL
jgi:hypothetical protein